MTGFLAVIMLGSVAGCAEESATYTTGESSVERSEKTAQKEVQENVQETASGETDVHATEEGNRGQREKFLYKKVEYGDTICFIRGGNH